MKKMLLLLCVMLSACGGGGGGGDSQPPAQKSEPAIEAKTATVFIGDSLTFRWDISKKFPGAINAGIGGQYTKDMLARFENDVIRHNPKTVIILGGTNDVIGMQAPNTDAIYAMAERARASGARVILCTIPPIGPSRPVAAVTPAQFNAALKAMAIANGFELVDYYAVLAAVNGDPLPGITWDDVHLTDKGYELIEGVLLSAL